MFVMSSVVEHWPFVISSVVERSLHALRLVEMTLGVSFLLSCRA